jgi:ribonuclease E
VRSDSSTALHVIRGIEEHLLKDARHHITVRTPTATALYVLNHKRSSLVELEQRFGLSIAVEADDDVGIQHFAITRGAPAEPRDTAAPDTVEDTPAFEAMETDDAVDAEVEETTGHHAHADHDEEGDAHRKRRRRRRRRGGRDHGDERDHHGGEPQTIEAGEADAAADSDEPEGTERELATEGAAGDEASSAEQKKRRRGRRGGKRNRRDHSEDAPEQALQGDEEPSVEAEAVSEASITEIVASEAPVESMVEDTEVAAEEAAPQPAEAEKPKKPARRPRKAKAAASEQPAIANGEDRPTAESAPEEEPVKSAEPEKEEAPVEPVVVSSTSDEAKPRKTGWWQRKSFF